MNIANFVGCWRIQWRDGVEGKGMEKDWILMIGTDSEYGDTPPRLTEEYAVCVGFAVLDENGVVQLSTDPPGEETENQQPLFLRLTGEQLRWKGYYEGQPLYIYISTAETWVPDGRSYVHLYGASTYGDPEQVAVWGGSGTPPPDPPPNRRHPHTGQGE